MADNNKRKQEPIRGYMPGVEMGLQKFQNFYKPTQAVNNYNDPYSIDRGLDIVYRLQQLYPEINQKVLAGIAANAMVESYGNPKVRQGQRPDATGPVLGGAVGLFGWDSARRDALMQKYPNDWQNIDNQLQYFVSENQGPEKRNWQRVIDSSNEEEAARNFAKYWERAGKPNMSKRSGLAKDIYRAMMDTMYNSQKEAMMPKPVQQDAMNIKPIPMMRRYDLPANVFNPGQEGAYIPFLDLIRTGE